ncbi:MAG: hypothetical protein ACP5MT_02420 [Candidatus Acidifodinimicrobium sp.]
MKTKGELERKILAETGNLRASDFHNSLQVWLTNIIVKTNNYVSDLKLEDTFYSKYYYSHEWPADITLEYDKNGRKIFEIIEVETIPISRIKERVKEIGGKAARSAVAELSDERFYTGDGLKYKTRYDEMNFSLCLNVPDVNTINFERIQYIADEIYKSMYQEMTKFKGINYFPRNFKFNKIYFFLNNHHLNKNENYRGIIDRSYFDSFKNNKFPIRPILLYKS